MIHEFKAIYENGVLRPLVALPLIEQERVTLHLSRHDDQAWLDDEFVKSFGDISDDAVTIEEVRLALSKIKGSMDEAIDQDRGEY